MIGDPARQRLALDLHVDPGGGQPLQELLPLAPPYRGRYLLAWALVKRGCGLAVTDLLEPKNWLIVTVMAVGVTPTGRRALGGGRWPRCSRA